ncbi:endonuclease [Gelidibacter salicanalis]|uniref:Endonuclease n=1 Tax=Gelidibacter salicanalis TaxID=291193 RepID=A0A5C7AIH7_9FLAO|nr:NUMOD1 domain-containing DNA-binding protein [Gelidibacter salicanalis]TXE08556.1 endonuclease [Gelidibacter salicanalis]
MKKNKKSAGIIYTVECKITGEFYVGATTGSIHQRELDHTERAKRGEKGRFYEAISTHGPDAFEWSQTDTANTTDNLARMEKEYIANFDSKNNGFNSDSGGGIKKTVYQYKINDGSLVNTYPTLSEAADAVNAAKTSIGNACMGQNKTCKGYHWSYNFSVPFNPTDDLRKKKVLQYSHSGKLINEFNSVSDASKLTGLSKTSISRVCRNEREKSGGFIWKYK